MVLNRRVNIIGFPMDLGAIAGVAAHGRKHDRELGIVWLDAVTNDVLQRLKAVDHIHVSFDPDCVDPSVAAGVGTPVTGGLTYREAHLCMETIAERGGMHSMDVVGVNPILDIRNQSSRLASDLVASGLGQRIF